MMPLLQEIRIRFVIALRQIGLIPSMQWARLELDRRRRKKRFEPMLVADGAHVLIVCAYYEHPEWARDMIASVQAQTFEGWTLVIMDDCSPNNPLHEAIAGINLDNKIITLQAEENRGAYVSRNDAITVANERHIPWTHVTFIDPDDVAYQNWLEHTLECIGDHEGVVRVILERWDEGLKTMKRRVLSHTPSMWSRGVWERLGGFANVRVAADTELLLRAEYAKPPVSFFHGIQPAQKCRVHEGNASQTSLIERKKWLLERKRSIQLGTWKTDK